MEHVCKLCGTIFVVLICRRIYICLLYLSYYVILCVPDSTNKDIYSGMKIKLCIHVIESYVLHVWDGDSVASPVK